MERSRRCLRKTCGFIIQDGKSSASEVLEVFRIVQERVYNQFDVMLYPEVKFIGDWQEELPKRFRIKFKLRIGQGKMDIVIIPACR